MIATHLMTVLGLLGAGAAAASILIVAFRLGDARRRSARPDAVEEAPRG